MTTFEFTLHLHDRITAEADMDAVYARCKDATIATQGELTFVHFDRDANTLDEAVRSAIVDLNAAGFRVARVEMDVDSLLPQSV